MQVQLNGVFQHKQCFHIAAHCNHKEDRVSRKVLFPFPIKRKDVLFLPNPTIASRQIDVKDPCLATYPFSFVHQERIFTVKQSSGPAWVKKHDAVLCGTHCTEIKFVVLLNIDNIVKTFKTANHIKYEYFYVTPCIEVEILVLNNIIT